jgi:hypothetical protein
MKQSHSGHGWVFRGIDIPLKLWQKYRIVAQWNLKPSDLCILLCMFVLMLLIVVLPDIDLPDTAFHRGTAPLVVHTRATSSPPAIAVASAVPFLITAESFHFPREERAAAHSAVSNFLPILFRSIRR